MSSLGIKQMYLLANKFEKVRWDPRRVTQLGLATDVQFRKIEAILDDQATVTTHNGRLTASAEFSLPVRQHLQRLKDHEYLSFSKTATALFETVQVFSALSVPRRRKVICRDTLESLNDFEILQDLGSKDAVVFNSVETLELVVAQLMVKQPEDRSCSLFNDGKMNLFYVRDPNNFDSILSVHIYWNLDHSKWKIDVAKCYISRWLAGARVFSVKVTT